jgi:hypothetical protein
MKLLKKNDKIVKLIVKLTKKTPDDVLDELKKISDKLIIFEYKLRNKSVFYRKVKTFVVLSLRHYRMYTKELKDYFFIINMAKKTKVTDITPNRIINDIRESAKKNFNKEKQ